MAESKTILEWLKELPEDIRERAIANHNNCTNEYFTKQRGNFFDALVIAHGAAFDWDDSPEGWDYWNAVNTGCNSGDYSKVSMPLHDPQELSPLQRAIELLRKANDKVWSNDRALADEIESFLNSVKA